MSETRWTPGPYRAYSGDDTNGWWVIHDSEDHEIGSTDGGFEFAEAHLFAAATDLYEALGALTKLERGDLVGAEFKKAMHAALRQSDAALAKARGES